MLRYLASLYQAAADGFLYAQIADRYADRPEAMRRALALALNGEPEADQGALDGSRGDDVADLMAA